MVFEVVLQRLLAAHIARGNRSTASCLRTVAGRDSRDLMGLSRVQAVSMAKKLKPVHPGEILREEFMVPLGLSATNLARALHVPVRRIAVITNERGGISADMARRLGRFFKMTAEFWMNLQAHYDLVSSTGQMK